MQWIKRDTDKEKVKELSERYGLDLITASILERRGAVTRRKSVFWKTISGIFTTHSSLMRWRDAVDRILSAKEEGEKVRIFGDRDVDGITSTVLLTEALESMDMDVT